MEARYYILVAYRLNRYAWGSIDNRIYKAAQRRSDGSGTGWGIRDISFSYYQKSAAKRCLARLKKEFWGNKRGISITLNEY